MHATHAKRVVPGGTYDLALRHACNCQSGERFKDCCYGEPRRGWGWVMLSEDGLSPVVTVSADLGPDPVILIFPTMRAAEEYLVDGAVERQTGAGVWVVRMPTAELVEECRAKLTADRKIMIVVDEACLHVDQEAVISIGPASP